MFKTIKVVGLETVVATCDWCDDAAMNAEDENHEWQTYELGNGARAYVPGLPSVVFKKGFGSRLEIKKTDPPDC